MPTRRIRPETTDAAVVVWLLVAAIVLLPLSVIASPRFLGGVDLEGYCLSIGGMTLMLEGTDAYSWHCITREGRELWVNVLEACKFTYADPAALDRLGNFHNPFSGALGDSYTHREPLYNRGNR